MNAKDLNLSSYVKDIIESGAVDALKIEGRTKSPYYVALTAKTYKRAIEDTLNGEFDEDFYQKELSTTINRGFSKGYLVQRPHDRLDTQNLKNIEEGGLKRVHGIVDESGEFFYAKNKVAPEHWYEVVLPKDSFEVKEKFSEIGEVKKGNGVLFLLFKKIKTKSGKELEAVHSGNTNEICLPCKLPPFSFLRD
jgi:putative protease